MKTKRDHAAAPQPEAPQSATEAPEPGHYEVDTGRSSIGFRTRHIFGLAPVRGTFAIKAGTVQVAEPLAESGVRVDVALASFHTGNRLRDSAVRSARFLDAHRHPLMTFQAERIEGTTVSGTLTARGITRPVSLSVEQTALSRREFTVRATARIDRTAFGVTGSRGMTGRYLDVTAEVRCVRT